MPNQPKHKHRMIRFSDEDWDEFGHLTTTANTDRSTILRQLALWWMRRQGIHLPARPEVGVQAKPVRTPPERPPEHPASVRPAPTVHTPAAPGPDASLRPAAGSIPFREPEPCSHPKARVLKGFCGNCGTHVG